MDIRRGIDLLFLQESDKEEDCLAGKGTTSMNLRVREMRAGVTGGMGRKWERGDERGRRQEGEGEGRGRGRIEWLPPREAF